MASNQRKIILLVAVVVMFAVAASVGWVLLPPDDEAVIPLRANAGADTVSDTTKTALIPELEKPEVGSSAEGDSVPFFEPKTTPTIEPVNLLVLSKYRKRVLEADLLLELTSGKALTDERKDEIAAKLLALKSRFASFVVALNDGLASASGVISFKESVRANVLDPDVGTKSWLKTDSERVSLWQRPNVRLPDPATDNNKGVPLERRRQESISNKAIESWLSAIESEYGKADFFAKDGLKPLDILVFESPEQFHKYTATRLRIELPSWSAGFFSSGWEVVAIPANERICMAEVLRHEIFHALQARIARQSLFVPWFSEGTAEWLDKAPPVSGVLQTSQAFLAAAYGYLGNLTRNGFKLQLQKFMKLDIAAFYENPKINYLMAYCLVDFLRSEEDLRPIYFEFWDLLKEGIEPGMAYARTFGGLDFTVLTRRFKERIAKEPVKRVAPHFLYDAKVDSIEQMPSELVNLATASERSGGIAPGWYDALEKLQEKGFDTSRSTYLAGQYDELVVAIDSSETMSQQITKDNFDFAALSRWLFSMRYAPSLKMTRKSADGKRDEPVPPTVIMSLVDAVILNKVKDFTEATGIKISKGIKKDINKGWKGFVLNESFLKKRPKRDIAMYTAESIAWYWGVRQGKSKVTVIDFNTDKMVRSDNIKFERNEPNKLKSPMQKLFDETESHKAPAYTDGADCNWHAALEAIINVGNEAGSKKFAFIMLTDGPSSFGLYSHTEGGRDSDVYLLDQSKMAKWFAEEWLNARLDESGRLSILQIVALPGAENEGLNEIPKACPQARLDEWVPRFVKQ